MTNTERLIADLEHCTEYGKPHVYFQVGKYTGNGPSVVAALRRRGYSVTRVPAIGVTCYRLTKPQPTGD